LCYEILLYHQQRTVPPKIRDLNRHL
jgi:hypothetical protein